MFAMRALNYQVLGSSSLIIYAVSIFLLLITLVPFIGSEIKGARSWIRFGFFGFQTSELSKFATVILLARYLEMKERDMDKIPSLLMASSISLLSMLLVVVQPDFGGAFSYAPVLISMLLVAGADFYHVGSVLIFFFLSLLIPLYIEYHNITLVEPLIAHLSELGQGDMLPAVRILKNDVWRFIDKGVIPKGIDGSDKEYLITLLQNTNIMGGLKEAVSTVRFEAGGLLLRILENDFLIGGIGLVFTIIAGALFVIRFTQGVRMQNLRKYYIPFGVLGLSLLAAVSVHMTFSFKYHQIVRVTAFVNPDKFPRDLAYQIRASKAAIGSGQFIGKGMFQGDMTLGNRPLVPEAYTDFIFTSWSERTGFLGTAFLLLVIFIIPLRGLQIAFDARDRFASLLASGMSFLLFYHMFFNIGIAVGLLPVTGLPLSFMSYGGSHLITCMAAVGVLMNIHRRRFAN
jgi:rod shape determining protein RodA